MERLKFVVITLLYSAIAYAQKPNIMGTVTIDTREGLIHCDFIITNFPKTDNPAFCLNKGFNVKDLKHNGKSTNFNEDWGQPFKNAFFGEAIGYAPIIEKIRTKH